jgi:hypothetical protein
MRVVDIHSVPPTPPLVVGKLYQYPYAVNLWQQSCDYRGTAGEFAYRVQEVLEAGSPFVVLGQIAMPAGTYLNMPAGTYLKVLTGSAEVGLVGYYGKHLTLAVDRKETP